FRCRASYPRHRGAPHLACSPRTGGPPTIDITPLLGSAPTHEFSGGAKLYKSEHLAWIDFGDYLKELSGMLTSAVGAQAPHAKVTIQAEDILLDIERAIPCALIVNELVSNAMKHAFPDGRQGEIRIVVRSAEAHLELEVGDTGIGFPVDVDFKNVATLGMQLVVSLTKQLRGTVELSREGGTTFRIRLPSPAVASNAIRTAAR
ncbi:MAG TPA: ATP-binding protein, partial [Haliangium sp.]|nr:ATP-binding protein [Haliangium sp.]